jgi:hypothetical protein
MTRSTLPEGVQPRGFNVDQAAEFLGVRPSSIKLMVRRGELKPVNMVNRYICDRRNLEAVFEK